MAKCRLCKTDIPNGIEYCENCQDKKDVKTKESYLDGLLNSIKNTTSPTNSVYKKKDKPVDGSNPANNSSIQNNSNPTLNSDNHKEVLDDTVFEEDTFIDYNSKLEDDYSHDFNTDNIDYDDLEDFSNYDINEDLEDTIIINDEDLFGKADTEDFIDPHEVAKDITDRAIDENISTIQSDNIIQDESFGMEDIAEATEEQFLSQLQDFSEEDLDYSIHELLPQVDQIDNNSETDVFNPDTQYQPEENVDHEFMLSSLLPEDYDMEDEFDPSIGELLSGIDFMENDSIPVDDQEPLNNDDPSEFKQSDQNADSQSEEEDLLSLLSQFSSEDPIAADVQAISDMLSGKAPINQSSQEDLPSDVGEVFSNALKAVTALNDPEADKAIFDALASEKQSKKIKKKKTKPEKVKKEKLKKSKNTDPKVVYVNGEGFLSRLFSNVVDKKAAEKKSKQEAAATTAPDHKSKKSKKKKKGAADISLANEEGLESARPEKEKQEDTKTKKKEKKVKEKKPKKNKEAIEVIDYDEDITRINPVGASIVFVFFGVLVVILLIATNIFSYSLSIKNAKTYFNRHDYTQAYNEVYGVDIKDEDIEIYDKIMTVMFVNKQLNSYNNYYAMEKYPEALDSLLKGLSRYEKYIELATMLGIKSDLDYVREQILAELDNEFSLTEKEAKSIIRSESQMEYSVAVYDIVLENMKYYK